MYLMRFVSTFEEEEEEEEYEQRPDKPNNSIQRIILSIVI